MDDFRTPYMQLVEAIMLRGFEEINERTNTKIKMLPIPASLNINLSTGRLPLPGNRKLFPKTAGAEVAWFLKGEKKLEWLQKYCKIWDLFQEEDGTVKGAYGYRWINHFGRDQIKEALKALKTNPTDRRIFISAWDPSEDGLGASGQKNVPCPVGFAINVIRGRLNLAVFLRSSDVFVGLPYDVMGYALLAAALARSLGYQLGFLHVTLAHAHIYEDHFEDALKSLKFNVVDNIEMPYYSIEEIQTNPEAYVEEVWKRSRNKNWPLFNPKPPVIV